MKFVMPSNPNNGDCRKRLKFAWKPMIATNQDKVGVLTEYKVWLEWVEIYEEFRKGQWVELHRHIKE
jgi:hypothetical protein